MTQDTPAALPVPTSATGGNWEEPTTVAQRLGDAMQLLCGGKRPPDDMVAGWLDNSSEDLQEFAVNHGPAWAQGIGLIDAAMVMVDQPTEILTPESDEDHEHRDAQAATSAAGRATGVDTRLLNLLARIHGDGGQYVDQHGVDKACDDADLLVAALAAQSPGSGVGPTHVHRKSGGRYTLIGEGKLQSDKPLPDMAEIAIYRGEDGRLWARDATEFAGRFDSAALAQQGAQNG